MRQRYWLLLAAFAVSLTGLVGLRAALPTPAQTADPYRLVYALSPDHARPQPLEGATVSGVIYPFTTPDARVDDVTFSLDGQVVWTEDNAPFDFAGGTETQGNPWDTSRVADGEHTITAELVLESGAVITIAATFIVSNAPAPGEPTPSPTEEATPTSTAGTEEPEPSPTEETATPTDEPSPDPPPNPGTGGSTEIATGAMLGGGNNPHWFYIRRSGGGWKPTYAGTALEGRLMNFRAANALFDDENRSDDNPDANTNAFISNFDDYKAHEILAMTVSLQGGNPGYEGALASAFNPDGSLKAAWMDRAGRVIEAADQRGMVIILTYFYQRQDQVLADEAAVKQAVINATDWLIASNYRNVIVEIANEFSLGYSPDHQFQRWQHEIIFNNTVNDGIGELVNLAKSRFSGKAFRLPVSASKGGIRFDGAIAQTGDVALVHGNGIEDWEGERDTYAMMRSIYDSSNVPVLMNEDDNGTTPNSTTLARDTHAMDDAISAGGSWGLMWKPYNQLYPFEWSLGDSKSVNSEAGYFHAILDIIQDRVY